MITREKLEADLARKSPTWWDTVSANKGRENYYYDRACRYGIVTIDRHAGTTPMTIACRNPKKCTGVMHSMGYPEPQAKPAWLGDPTHEWYRPDEIDDESETFEADHLMNGGLLLRRIDGGQ